MYDFTLKTKGVCGAARPRTEIHRSQSPALYLLRYRPMCSKVGAPGRTGTGTLNLSEALRVPFSVRGIELIAAEREL